MGHLTGMCHHVCAVWQYIEPSRQSGVSFSPRGSRFLLIRCHPPTLLVRRVLACCFCCALPCHCPIRPVSALRQTQLSVGVHEVEFRCVVGRGTGGIEFGSALCGWGGAGRGMTAEERSERDAGGEGSGDRRGGSEGALRVRWWFVARFGVRTRVDLARWCWWCWIYWQGQGELERGRGRVFSGGRRIRSFEWNSPWSVGGKRYGVVGGRGGGSPQVCSVFLSVAHAS